MTYQQKLEAFAARATKFEQARLCQAGKPTIWAKPANGDACACCGTTRLKTLYPVVLDGDPTRLEWIGRECCQNLKEMGKLVLPEYDPMIPWFPEVAVEV